MFTFNCLATSKAMCKGTDLKGSVLPNDTGTGLVLNSRTLFLSLMMGNINRKLYRFVATIM